MARNFSGNTPKLEFAESSEVVHQSDDSVLVSAEERNEAPVLVFGGDDHRDELVDELIRRWDWGHPFVSCFVVDSHADLDFVLGEVGFGRGGTGDLKNDNEMLRISLAWWAHGYMAMLEADSDGTEVFGNRFGYRVNFVKGRASSCQGTGDFVNKNRASKAAGRLKKLVFRRRIEWSVRLLTAFRQCFLGFCQRQRRHQRRGT